MTSRFLQKVAQTAAPIVAPVSRFLSRHRTINRIVRRIPIVTKFMAFFVPEELRLDPPELESQPEPQAQNQHEITPVYNRRARKPRGLTLG